jgi:hypothetical protein
VSQSPPDVVHQQVERRRVPRWKCDLVIDIEWGAAQIRAHVCELSVDSMFVELDPPLWIGAKFAARLALAEPVQLECVVRRVEPRRGMALSFSSGEAERALIALALEKLAKQ